MHDKRYYHSYSSRSSCRNYPTLIPKTTTPTPETLPSQQPPDGLGRRPPPRPRRGHRDENRLPQLPRHRHHGVFAERGQTRSGAADGQPRIRPHHRALRQTQRPGLARRGREDIDLKSNRRRGADHSGHSRPSTSTARLRRGFAEFLHSAAQTGKGFSNGTQGVFYA